MASRAARWQSSPQPEDRIRRNVACVNCRNSKVRCRQSQSLGEPCQRCAKLGASCVVDKSHKRITKRSKIDKLEKELDAIKQAVHVQPQAQAQAQAQAHSTASSDAAERSSLPLARSNSHPTSHPQTQHQRSTFHLTPSSLPEQTPGSAAFPPKAPAAARRTTGSRTSPSQPRTIGTYNLSGVDIGYYFDKYLECFHHFVPVLRKSDPDECFEANPTLFWVILFVVTRRYAKDSRIFAIIVENLSKDVWTLLSSPIMGLEAIHCLLIIGAWPLPTIRFASDPSTIFSGIAVHGCMLLGLHTGKGCHPEFCVAARNHITCSDQEASASWLQACILASRSASSLGHPPPSIQLNDAPAKKALATPEWAYLLVEFDIQKFLNRLHLAMASHIASNGFVTESMVTDWENELETLRSIISRHDTELSHFMLLAAKQEIQTYYFSHDPNDPGPNLTLNHTRTLTTSKSIISTALALEATPTKLITHGPHWVFRSIVDAACLLTSALHSSTPPPLDPSCPEDAAQHLFRQCQTAVLTCSVRDGDLPFRAASMMRGFYHCREEVPHCDPPAMAWPNRVGASVTFWCLSRYHRALSEAQKNSESARQALREIQIPKQQQESKDTPEQGPSVDQLDDPFQEVDWSLFMDDIGWGTGDPVFMGLP